jgi:hypothetical protein
MPTEPVKYISPENQALFLQHIKTYIDTQSGDVVDPNSFRFREVIADTTELAALTDNRANDLVIVLVDTFAPDLSAPTVEVTQSSLYRYYGDPDNEWKRITAIEIENRDFTAHPLLESELSEDVQTKLNPVAWEADEVLYTLFTAGFVDWFAIASNEILSDVGIGHGNYSYMPEYSVPVTADAEGRIFAKFTKNVESVANWRMSFMPINIQYIRFWLYDENKVLIGQASEWEIAELNAGNDSQLPTPLPAGTYYVRIEIFSDPGFTTPVPNAVAVRQGFLW